MIDRETGEILTARTVYTRSDEIAVAFNPREAGRKGKRFVKHFNSRDAKRQASRLTLQENGLIRVLSMYAAPDTNILIGDGETGTKGLALSFKELMQVSGVSEPTFLKLLKRMTEIGVIEKLDRGYRLNEQTSGVRCG